MGAVVLVLSTIGSNAQAAFESEASRLFWQQAAKDRAHAQAGFALWREHDASQRKEFQKRIRVELDQQKERSDRWWDGRKTREAAEEGVMEQKQLKWEQETSAQRDAFHQEFEARLRQRDQKRRTVLR